MGLFDRAGEFDPTKTYAVDTTRTDLGAPDLPGVVRFRIHPSGVKYGLQGFRLVLNETDATASAGKGLLLVEGETAANGVAAGDVSGAALTTPLNLFAGVPQVDIADNYWGWAQVWGIGQAYESGGGTADGAKIETAASGTFTDTAGTGIIVGVALEAKTTGLFSVFFAVVSPRG